MSPSRLLFASHTIWECLIVSSSAIVFRLPGLLLFQRQNLRRPTLCCFSAAQHLFLPLTFYPFCFSLSPIRNLLHWSVLCLSPARMLHWWLLTFSFGDSGRRSFQSNRRCIDSVAAEKCHRCYSYIVASRNGNGHYFLNREQVIKRE